MKSLRCDLVNRYFIPLWAVLFTIFSAGMMLALPINRVPDEYAHLSQSYVIADGQWYQAMKTRTVTIPQQMHFFENPAIDAEGLKQAYEGVDFSGSLAEEPLFTNAALYPPVSYFPQACGIRLASLFTGNGVIIAYSGRIVNWLCTFLVLLWAMRKLPAYRKLLAFLTLLPMNLQEMISLSADGMTTALVYALTAFVLNGIHHRKRFEKKDYFALVLLSLGTVLWKVLYFPAVFLILLLPAECFGSPRKKWTVTGVVILALAGLLLLWAGVCYFLLFQAAAGEEGRERSTLMAIEYLMRHPLEFPGVLYTTVSRGLKNYLGEIFAKSLSWYSIHPSPWLVYSSMTLCVLTFLAEDSIALRLKTRLAFSAVPCFSILLLFFVLYLWWTPVGEPLIYGFQGRYLMPLLLMLLAAFKPHSAGVSWWTPVLYLGVAAVNCGFLLEIIRTTL